MIIYFYKLAVRCLFLALLFIGPAIASGSPAEVRNILVLGDSISAAYGMSLDEGWVALLQRRLDEQQRQVRVINASISGETSVGAVNRLPLLLKEHQPDILILELGGNDGLRGYPIKRFHSNMETMSRLAMDSGARVLLLGMEIPPNYGQRYTTAFRDSYRRLAEELDLTLVPFFMEKVATSPELMQNDGIHPKASAQDILLETLWPQLETLL